MELMVALALSLLLVAAMFVSCLGTLAGSRQQRALSDMAQRAQLAFSLIRRDIQAAGYVHPTEISNSRFNAADATVIDRPVFGCRGVFPAPGAPVGQSSCPPAGGATDAIEINFEAARDSALLDSSGRLADCQGTALQGASSAPQTAAASGATRIASAHRYFVDTVNGTPALMCASAVSAKAELVPHVETLQVRYGLSSGWLHHDPALRRPSRFVRADQVANPQWPDVVAVRLCLLVRSPEPAVVGGEDGTGSYLDCDGQLQSDPSGPLRRAYVTTIAVRNRGAM